MIRASANESRTDPRRHYSIPADPWQTVLATALAAKHTPRGNALEKQCEDQFDSLLAQFKAELLSNGFPLTATLRAQPVYDYDTTIYRL
jgi:hypothetical protein